MKAEGSQVQGQPRQRFRLSENKIKTKGLGHGSSGKSTRPIMLKGLGSITSKTHTHTHTSKGDKHTLLLYFTQCLFSQVLYTYIDVCVSSKNSNFSV
jgi:hypothetical protein